MTDGLSLLQRAAVAVLVPAKLREAFTGDLLEELPKRSGGWIWRQLFRSTPSLLGQQLRADRPGAVQDRVNAALFVGVSVILAQTNGIFALSAPSQSVIATGAVLLAAGLLFSTRALQMSLLVAGVATFLTGQALADGTIGDGFFLVMALPGYAYSISLSSRKRSKVSARTARLLGVLGGLSILVGTALGSFVLIQKLALDEGAAGRPMLLAGGVLLALGLTFVGIAVLSARCSSGSTLARGR